MPIIYPQQQARFYLNPFERKQQIKNGGAFRNFGKTIHLGAGPIGTIGLSALSSPSNSGNSGNSGNSPKVIAKTKAREREMTDKEIADIIKRARTKDEIIGSGFKYINP